MIAPTPQLAAGLEVLHQALVAIRMLGWSGEAHGLDAEASRRVAALADAVHNLPHLLLAWESCDRRLLEAMLAEADRARPELLLHAWRAAERRHQAPPDGAWRIAYADGSGNRYTLAAGEGDVEVVYDPVTAASSSSGCYSGGAPWRTTVARDDGRLATLWSHLHLACLGWGVARAKGTGAFTLTTAEGARDQVLAPGPTVAAIERLLAELAPAAP